MQQKPNLDLLRSIAVVLVILDHLLLSTGVVLFRPWQASQIGLFGVYLFFVHTSLVLMWSLDRRPNVLDFYIRRAFRIYPLAIFAVVLAGVLHAPVGFGIHGFFDSNHVVTAKQVLINAALVNGLYDRIPFVLGVTWSLGPEVFMYVILPCLFFYASRTRRNWPLLMLWLLVVLFDFHIFNFDLGNSLPTVMPNFIAGVVAYVGFMRRRETIPAVLFVPFLSILFAFYMTFSNYRAEWVLTLVLALVLPSFRQIQAKRLKKVSLVIATYSYGIYLLHPFALVVGINLMPNARFRWQLLVFIAITATSTFLAYWIIERPMINVGARIAQKLAHERGTPSKETLEQLEPAP